MVSAKVSVYGESVAPGTYDIAIYRGDDWSLPLYIRSTDEPPVYQNLTGWTGLSQIRVSADSAVVVATITVTILNQVTALGGILLSIDKLITAGINIDLGVWDLELTDAAGETSTYLRGGVEVTKDVSRIP